MRSLRPRTARARRAWTTAGRRLALETPLSWLPNSPLLAGSWDSCASLIFSTSQYVDNPLPETTAPAQKLRSATLGGANRHIKLVGVVGLLIVVALVGVLGLAMHSSLAIESQPAIQSTAFAEPGFASAEPHSASTPVQQPNSPATANAGTFLGSTDQVEVDQGRLIVRKVRIVDIDVSQASDASALVPNPASEAPKSVPLPIKKPARPIQSLSSR